MIQNLRAVQRWSHFRRQRSNLPWEISEGHYFSCMV